MNGLPTTRSSVPGVRERTMRSTATAEAVAELGLLKNMDLVKKYPALRPVTAIRYSIIQFVWEIVHPR